MINSKIFDILNEINKVGSITIAADELFLSQPYVSKVLKATEKQLNVELVDRKSKPVTLTYAGTEFLDGLKGINTKYRQLENKMKSISESKTGHISVGISESMGELFLPDLTAEFFKHYPNYRLNIIEKSSKEIQSMVIKNELDLYIGMMPIFNNNFVYRKMKHVSFGLFGSGAGDKIESIDGLRKINQKPFIAIDNSMILGEIIHTFLKSVHISPKTIIEVKNINTALQMANKGVGDAIIPLNLIDLYPNQKNIIEYQPITSKLLESYIIMAHRKLKENTPEMMAFLEISQKYFDIDPKKQRIYHN